jgi:predicted peptidase
MTRFNGIRRAMLSVVAAAGGTLVSTGCATTGDKAMVSTGSKEKPASGKFLDRTITFADGVEGKYVVFLPTGYGDGRRWPTILFLHGKGERGTDNQKQITVGLAPAIRKRVDRFGFIVVFPQAVENWSQKGPDLPRAAAILDAVEKEYAVDASRVYLTGLSMGGHGTWALAAQQPKRFAAIAPICGYGDAATASTIAQLPIWCFHGGADGVVPVDSSRRMIAAVKAAGGSPRYTEYPGVGHNSWEKAYDTDELYEWLLSHRRTDQ